MSLTLADARRVMDAAMAKAEAEGWTVTIAVVDQRGDLLTLVRMDGVGHFTPAIASGKAQASAVMRRPSVTLQENRDGAIVQAVDRLAGRTMVFHQGAVPLLRDGRCVGAVGVSGATSEQDEEAAAAGASAL